jgi:hypothetical protein
MNMSLAEWHRNGWLRPLPPDRIAIAAKLRVVERDLRFSGDQNSEGDWRFVAAFNAALQSATVALLASGYDLPKGTGSHQRMIDTLKFTIGADPELVDALQAFRGKRGGAVYESVGIASENEIEEMRTLAVELNDLVLVWMNAYHKDLL